MASCAVLTCTARSDNPEDSALRFHKFPTNDDLRKRWVEATGRGKWSPADDNYICSRHFRDNDYFIKRSGKRYLKNGAIPCEYIVYANLYPDNFPVPSPEVAEEPEPVPAENPANPEPREDEFVELNTESDDDSEAASWDQLHALVNSAQDLHAQQGAGVHPAFREIQRIITKRKSYTRKDYLLAAAKVRSAYDQYLANQHLDESSKLQLIYNLQHEKLVKLTLQEWRFRRLLNYVCLVLSLL